MLYLLIVARNQPELYQALLQEVGANPHLLVLLDRRRANRRRQALAVPVDQRRTERRSFPRIEDDPNLRHYILLRPHSRRPRD